jgi:hypothetical protein
MSVKAMSFGRGFVRASLAGECAATTVRRAPSRRPAAWRRRCRQSRWPRAATRQQAERLLRRQANAGRLHRHAQVRAARRRRHQHGQAQQPGEELLVVDRVAVAAHALELAVDAGRVGQRGRREALERRVGQQPPALRRGQLRQDHLAAGRAMHRHPRTGVQVEAQRGRRLDPIEVDHLAARQRREVAAFADLVDQRAQHDVACAVPGVVQQQVLGQSAQPHAGAVVAAVALALQQAARLELLQHPVQRGLRQPGLLDEALQRDQLVSLGDYLEQREQPHRRRVAIDFDGLGPGRGDELHGPHDSRCSDYWYIAYRIPEPSATIRPYPIHPGRPMS